MGLNTAEGFRLFRTAGYNDSSEKPHWERQKKEHVVWTETTKGHDLGDIQQRGMAGVNTYRKMVFERD